MFSVPEIAVLSDERKRVVYDAGLYDPLEEEDEHILRKAALTEADAFALFRADNPGDYISFSSFCQALSQLGLTNQPDRLSTQDVRHLWTQADVDGDGILNYLDFQACRRSYEIQDYWESSRMEKGKVVWNRGVT